MSGDTELPDPGDGPYEAANSHYRRGQQPGVILDRSDGVESNRPAGSVHAERERKGEQGDKRLG